VFEIVRWCNENKKSAAQAELENSVEALTPYMTAVLREHFDIANLLMKNNLATKGYVNREGRDVRQIAEDSNRVRALAFLDNREIPRPVLKRDTSVGQGQPQLQSRFAIKKPIMTERRTSNQPLSSAS